MKPQQSLIRLVCPLASLGAMEQNASALVSLKLIAQSALLLALALAAC